MNSQYAKKTTKSIMNSNKCSINTYYIFYEVCLQSIIKSWVLKQEIDSYILTIDW